jgi:diacylglycerol kinase family enzyme
VAVVFNPVTGGGEGAERRRDTEQALAGAGLDVLWLETTREDPGQGVTRRAVAEGVDLVIAQGGDGTVMACVTGLAGSDVPLAVLPGGTGNDLVRGLGLPPDPVAAARALADCRPRRRPARFRLRLDDRDPIGRVGQGVLVGNLGRLQGGLPIMPDARPDDGLLDVAVLRTRTLPDWLRLAARVLLRRRRKDPELEVFRARRIEVRCDRPQPVERDGDPAGESDHLVVEVVPAALTLCVPRQGRNP